MKRLKMTGTMLNMWLWSMIEPDAAAAVVRDGMQARNARIACEASKPMARWERPKLKLVKS